MGKSGFINVSLRFLSLLQPKLDSKSVRSLTWLAEIWNLFEVGIYEAVRSLSQGADGYRVVITRLRQCRKFPINVAILVQCSAYHPLQKKPPRKKNPWYFIFFPIWIWPEYHTFLLVRFHFIPADYANFIKMKVFVCNNFMAELTSRASYWYHIAHGSKPSKRIVVIHSGG